MNLNQIINMVVRILMRKAIHKGVNAGIDAASGLARRRDASGDEAGSGNTELPQGQGSALPKLTEEQRQAKRAVRMARRAARANKL